MKFPGVRVDAGVGASVHRTLDGKDVFIRYVPHGRVWLVSVSSVFHFLSGEPRALGRCRSARVVAKTPREAMEKAVKRCGWKCGALVAVPQSRCGPWYFTGSVRGRAVCLVSGVQIRPHSSIFMVTKANGRTVLGLASDKTSAKRVYGGEIAERLCSVKHWEF